jgi:hypothetical protein
VAQITDQIRYADEGPSKYMLTSELAMWEAHLAAATV